MNVDGNEEVIEARLALHVDIEAGLCAEVVDVRLEGHPGEQRVAAWQVAVDGQGHRRQLCWRVLDSRRRRDSDTPVAERIRRRQPRVRLLRRGGQNRRVCSWQDRHHDLQLVRIRRMSCVRHGRRYDVGLAGQVRVEVRRRRVQKVAQHIVHAELIPGHGD
eukprot:scaffold825_cov249-Pinguiococcus_pyrenoidosus.AAC.28